jgi:hypothetical protein
MESDSEQGPGIIQSCGGDTDIISIWSSVTASISLDGGNLRGGQGKREWVSI